MCPPLRSISMPCHPKPVRPVLPTRQTGFGLIATPSLRPWLCGLAKQPSGFVENHCKPRGLGVTSRQSLLLTRLPRHTDSTLVLRLNQDTVHDFVLLFLPPCGPPAHDPAGHGVPRTKLTFLLHTGGLTDIDRSRLFFTCTSTNQAATCTYNN
jgi:hypothetical protein